MSMDAHKKKLLTQSVAFFQGNLVITPELLDGFKAASVLSPDEVKLIQKDDTTSGQILELLCMVKRKDNRSFNRFLQVLEENQCTALVSMFKTKTTISEVMLTDPRTLSYLEEEFANTAISQKVIQKLASRLVTKEIYNDEVSTLQDKLAHAQKVAKARVGKSATSPTTASPASQSPEPSNWKLSAQLQEKDSMLKQRNSTIKRKDEEYLKLRAILEDTQADLQSVLDLNNQYLTIISQMNTMQLASAQTPRDRMSREITQQMMDLERRLQESTDKIHELESELDDVSEELLAREDEVEKLAARENKYKSMLGLPDDVDEYAIEAQIEKLLTEGKLQKKEIDVIKKELFKTRQSKAFVEEKMTTLLREKEKIEFHMRQQDLTIKKLKRQRTANETLSTTETVLGTKLNLQHGHPSKLSLPAIERPTSVSLTARRAAGNQQYCMFCRTEYQPMKAQMCRVHFRPIRSGKWVCCKDDSHRGAGCLQVPHFYIEVTVDKKILLTDGAKYMELC